MSVKKMAKVLIKIALPVIFILICLEFLMIVLDPYLFKGFFEYESSDSKILDVGCGTGAALIQLELTVMLMLDNTGERFGRPPAPS